MIYDLYVIIYIPCMWCTNHETNVQTLCYTLGSSHTLPKKYGFSYGLSNSFTDHELNHELACGPVQLCVLDNASQNYS